MKLSVIIPVHNTEPFLRACLDSVRAQTLADIEIIAVDDGSSDGSRDVLAEYAEKGPPRLTLLTLDPSGPGAARNAGLEVARGEYVAFLDSDDMVPADAYEALWMAARRDGADIVTGIAESFRGSRRWVNPQMQELYANIGGPMRLADAPVLGRDSSPCNKLIRRELIETTGLRFPSGIDVREDLHFVLRAYAAAEAVSIIPNIIYHYRLRPETAPRSLTQLKTEKIVRDLLWVHRDLAAQLPASIGRDVRLSFEQGIVANIAYRLGSAVRQLEPARAEELLAAARDEIEGLEPAAFEALIDAGQALTMELVRRGLTREARRYLVGGVDAVLVDDLASSGALSDAELARRVVDHQQQRIMQLAQAAQQSGSYRDQLAQRTRDLKKRVNGFRRRRMRDVKLATGVALQARQVLTGRSRRIWVVGERRGLSAQDTGYRFFRYLREARPDIDAYFVTTPAVASKLSDRSHVLEYGSLAAVRTLLSAEAVVYSDAGMDLYRHWPLMRKRLDERVVGCFLQHGVIGMGAMRGFYHRSRMLKRGELVDVFVTSSDRERRMVVERMGHPPENVVVAGLSRFDDLDPGGHGEREVLVLPTWRDWLKNLGADEFLASDYFRALRSLLSDERLRQILERSRYSLVFCPHFSVAELFRELGDLPTRVRIMDSRREGVQPAIRRASALITDYSSVGFDFGYQYKPVVYYMADRSRWVAANGTLGLDYERDLPGPVARTQDEVVTHLESVVARGCSMTEEQRRRADGFFRYRDARNCERIASAIEDAIARKLSSGGRTLAQDQVQDSATTTPVAEPDELTTA